MDKNENVADKKYYVVNGIIPTVEIITQNDIMGLLNKFEERNTTFKYIEKFLKGEEIRKGDKLKIAVELLKANNEVRNDGLVFILNDIVSDSEDSIQLKEIVISLEDYLEQKMSEQDKLHRENPEEESKASTTIDHFMHDRPDYFYSNSEEASRLLSYISDYIGNTQCAEIVFNIMPEQERNEMSLFDVIDLMLESVLAQDI